MTILPPSSRFPLPLLSHLLRCRLTERRERDFPPSSSLPPTYSYYCSHLYLETPTCRGVGAVKEVHTLSHRIQHLAGARL